MKNRSRYQRQIKAMTSKSIEFGFKNISECESAGYGSELKNAFENEK